MDENNIVSLPDSVCLWFCCLCGVNIQSSIKDNPLESPVVFSSNSSPSDQKMIFCSTCQKNKSKEVEQYVAQKLSCASYKDAGFLLKDSPKPWKVYESEKLNVGGFKLKVLAWQTKIGIQAAVLVSDGSSDRVICGNFVGMTNGDFLFGLEAIKSNYKKEFGDLKLIEENKELVLRVVLPCFRSMMLVSGSYFSIYTSDSISCRIGFSEIELGYEDFSELSEMLDASSVFLQLGSMASLNELKKKKDVILSSKKNSDIIIQSVLKSGVVASISIKNNFIVVSVGYAKWHLQVLDFVDISNICYRISKIFPDKNKKRLEKFLSLLRADRYIRINNLIHVTYKVIMRDLGWQFDISDLLGTSKYAS